jgi:hypothetical protein
MRRLKPALMIALTTMAIGFALAREFVAAEAAGQATPGKVTKQAALSSIARNVLVPGYVDLAAKSAVLSKAQTPTAASLD